MPQSSGSGRERQQPGKQPSNRGTEQLGGARVVLDEDVPATLAAHLQARGINCETVQAIRDRLGVPPGGKFRDDEVAKEVARVPSVLITLNIRDYADFAFIKMLAEQYRISVVIVRPPKREARKGQRAPAIHDIVQQHAHKIRRLHERDPVIVSANRVGFRRRSLDEIHGEVKDSDSVAGVESA